MSSSCRVLIVDDNRDAAEMIGSLLEAFGHRAEVVHGGRDGMAAAAAFQPGLVFLDLGMPDVSGYEVARHIRGIALPSQPLLVALTGWTDAETMRRIAAEGMDGYLCKPATTGALMAWVERALAQPGVTGPSEKA